MEPLNPDKPQDKAKTPEPIPVLPVRGRAPEQSFSRRRGEDPSQILHQSAIVIKGLAPEDMLLFRRLQHEFMELIRTGGLNSETTLKQTFHLNGTSDEMDAQLKVALFVHYLQVHLKAPLEQKVFEQVADLQGKVKDLLVELGKARKRFANEESDPGKRAVNG